MIGVGVFVGLPIAALLFLAFDARDGCHDNGGIWVGNPGRCVCSNLELGSYKGDQTDLQVKQTAFCNAKPNGSMWDQEDVDVYRSLR